MAPFTMPTKLTAGPVVLRRIQENDAAAVPKRLGYWLDRIEDRDPQAPAESRRQMIWVTP